MWECCVVAAESRNWRHLEAKARLLALSLHDPESKRVMLSIADGYKRLAERAEVLSARQLDGASFGPEPWEAIGHAFDTAWTVIAANFPNDPVEIEAAREKLANALLSIASEDSRDVEVLKNAALQRLALDYRRL